MGLEDLRAAQKPSRIVMADDPPLFRSAIRQTLESHADFEVVGEAADGGEALATQCHHNPVAVPGVQWRPTGIDDLHKPLRFGPSRPVAVKRRCPDGPEKHGVPGSTPGPVTR
jgi:CheY-like chemotaxis protein